MTPNEREQIKARAHARITTPLDVFLLLIYIQELEEKLVAYERYKERVDCLFEGDRT